MCHALGGVVVVLLVLAIRISCVGVGTLVCLIRFIRLNEAPRRLAVSPSRRRRYAMSCVIFL